MQITRQERERKREKFISSFISLRVNPPLLNRFFPCLSSSSSSSFLPSFLSNRARSRKLAAHAAAKRKLKEGSRLSATPSPAFPLVFNILRGEASASSRNFRTPSLPRMRHFRVVWLPCILIRIRCKYKFLVNVKYNNFRHLWIQ